MRYKFSDLVNISKIEELLDSLFAITGLCFGLHDTDGNLILAVGWNRICSEYYRAHEQTRILCQQSDDYLINNLNLNEPYLLHQCKNGLFDAATPIIIGGQHLATIFHGQFLFTELDKNILLEDINRYGFDSEQYFLALQKVPIYNKAKLDSIMHFIRYLAQTLGELGLVQLQLIESKEKAVAESEKRLKTIIENAPNIAIQSYDVNGRLLYANKASEYLFEYSNFYAIGKTLDQLFLDTKTFRKFTETLKKIIKTGIPQEIMEFDIKIGKNNVKSVYSILLPLCLDQEREEIIAMEIDITEKKRIEKELYRLDQLKIVGQMAAGLAHEIRNPLTTVRGYLQLLQNRNQLIEFKSQFGLMIDEIDRANSIISEFLSLAKTKPAATMEHNLNDVIDKLFPLIQADAFSRNMDITFDPGEIPDISINAKEINQLILNLCRNGLEAMQPGGRLKIKTYKDMTDLILQVEDQGMGISQENLSMIGKPFFSTKDSGTGLGLAVCYNIALRHNAKIDINTCSNGTTFMISFRIPEN